MLRISNDLERIGDLAENIALKATTLGDEFRPNSVMLQIDAHVLTYMLENPRNIASCLGLSLCAKDLKRMSDHTANIAETVCYIVEGEMVPDKHQSAATDPGTL